MKLEILCRAAALSCPKGHESDEVLSIVTDSRQATPGSMFICIRGIHDDGHRFIADAVKRGARWIVAEHETLIGCDKTVVYLFTDCPRRASAHLFDAWYGHPAKEIKLIGVTGTNGKTTVTSLIHDVLTNCGIPCGLIGTMGCRIGNEQIAVCDDRRANLTTPDPEFLYKTLARMKQAGAMCVAMEVSSHALMLEKVSPLQFAVGIFTNLTPEHLDFHRSMEEYANAKARLLSQCEHAIINADADYADKMIAHARAYTTCSIERADADVYADSVSISDVEGVCYQMHMTNACYTVRCRIPAQFTVMNSMQALLAVKHIGIPLAGACDALLQTEGVRGRIEKLALPERLGITAIIDYAHTPDALQNLLRAVRTVYLQRRIVLLFGCGGDRDRSKRPVMGKIASELADAVVLTSDNSRSEDKRSIIMEILAGVSFSAPCTVISDRAAAIRYAVQIAVPGDVLVLAGKGHEEYEIDGLEKRPFSESALLMSACEEKLLKFERTERNEMP